MRDLAAAEAWFRAREAHSPIGEYLGFTHVVLDGETVFRLDCTRAGGIGGGVSRLHHDTVLAFADNCLGLALSAEARPVAPATTIDLRIDWLTPLQDGPLWCAVDTGGGFRQTASSYATLWQADRAQPCARAVGRFMVGVLPGGAQTGAGKVDRRAARSFDPDGFYAFVGFEHAAPGYVSVPPRDHLLGMVAAGTFHGGVVAALCDEAARSLLRASWPMGDLVCASIEVDYLRPSLARASLNAEAELIRLDGDVANISVIVRNGPGDAPLTATAILFFHLAP